jgi:8-oxo-dGTP pyrophosphatase MutT (NUDIX family)
VRGTQIREAKIEFDLDELRRRLTQHGPPVPSAYGDDGAGREATALIAAAVLVPIVIHPEGLTVLFTQRTAQLKSHSGQVSFPGGRAEPDDPSPEFTALREAQEEIGLSRAKVEVVARLSDYFVRTGFRVTPVVGLLTPPLALAPDSREVAEVFEVPLAFLLDPRNHQRQTRELRGQSVGFYVMHYGSRTIWGATAGMLVNLYRQLTG